MTWLWPWPRRDGRPPQQAPTTSPERARRIAKASAEWDGSRRRVADVIGIIAFHEKRLAEHRAELARHLAEEAAALHRLEEATRAP